MADVLGKRRRPQLPVPFLTPGLSSLWIGLVTPVDAGVARPLIESLASETVVTDPAPAAAFDVRPIGCLEALRRARQEEQTRVGVMLSGSWSSGPQPPRWPSPRSSASRGARARPRRWCSVEFEHEGSSAAARPRRSTTAASRSSPPPTSSPPRRPRSSGEDPFALEAIEGRLEDVDGEAAGKAALDAALHDWIGHRLGVPLWRLLGLSPDAPPTSYTIGIDSLEGTRDRARRASEFRALKIKVGGAEDLERLEAVREESHAPLRVDANEGWTLESARELMPELIRLGVEFVEQPFPAADLDSFHALRELHPRLPVVVDEGCQDLRDVAPAAAYADGINVKLAKSGGVREAVRMIHAARALGLRVMLGCMVESQLGVAPAVAIASLADWADLDGHLLLAEQPFAGLRLEHGHVLPGLDAGPRGGARVSERLAIFAEGLFAKHTGKTAHGVIRYGNRDVVAVIDSTVRGADRHRGGALRVQPAPIVATLEEAIECGADSLLIGVAPPGGKLDPAWRPVLLEAVEAGCPSRPACTPS